LNFNIFKVGILFLVYLFVY